MSWTFNAKATHRKGKNGERIRTNKPLSKRRRRILGMGRLTPNQLKQIERAKNDRA